MNFPLFWCQSATYTSNKRYIPLWFFKAVSFLLLLGFLSTHIRCPWKRREGGYIRYMEHLQQHGHSERCKTHSSRNHIVHLFTIGVRDTFASFLKHPIFTPCVFLENIPNNSFLVSSAKLPIFISITSHLFSQIIDSFVDFWSGWKLMTNTETLVVRDVRFTHALWALFSETWCLHR